MQWEYISGAVTKSIMDNADNAKSDGGGRRSIASRPDQLMRDPSILSTKIGDEAPRLQEWVEQA